MSGSRILAVVLVCSALSGAGNSLGQICSVSSDGSSCEPLACSAIPEDQCLPGVIRLDVVTGALTVSDCNCIDFNLCHIEFGNASAFAVGNCPEPQVCEVIASDADNDGIDDTFRAGCFPTGPCCLDIDDGPIPFDTCLELEPNTCEQQGGRFENIGALNQSCEPTQACCLLSFSGSICADLPPSCCFFSGGTPQDPDSVCNPPPPPACGGIAGLQCPTGLECVDDPSDNCDPSQGGSDCIGMCIQHCGGIAGLPCPGGFECVDDPADDCDPQAGGADCIGICTAIDLVCPRICGGFAGNPCLANEFCKFPEGVCNDATDRTGVCTPIPNGCPDVWVPVCGCDGMTYGNECEADAAGVSVLHEGECEVGACCADMGGIPLPLPVCFDTTLQKCIADFMFFEGMGTTCQSVSEACCMPLGNCVQVGPVCCAGFGGVSLGPDSHCDSTAAQCGSVCGGFAGIPCDDPIEFCKTAPGQCCCDFFGICTATPDSCPVVFDPVCGCDDRTYPNECEADRAGVSVNHKGPCVQNCLTNADCPAANQFCQFPIGACDPTSGVVGLCTDRPDACPSLLDPVCGCDGNTYGNACEANIAGVSVLHVGPCGPVGACCLDIDDGPLPLDTCVNTTFETCALRGGVFSPVNVTCDATEACCLSFASADFCADLHPFCCLASGGVPQGTGSTCQDEPDPIICGGFAGIPCPPGYDCVDDPNDDCDPANGSADCIGICVPPPNCSNVAGILCPDGFVCVDDPTDDCDPSTSFADCPSMCLPDNAPCVEICGGFPGIQCDDPSEFCKLPPGHCCCDFFGVCTPIPGACPRIFDPVCGCDGRTYSNKCEADAAGVSIDHAGACGQLCSSDADCSALNQFCKFPEGTCGGSTSNVAGECTTRPDVCPQFFDPVCGCDGNTYENECEADRSGVSVLHRGPCSIACTTDSDCPAADQFCQFPVGSCGTTGDVGQCTTPPTQCPLVSDPVCGCDGMTYGNKCEAARAGVSIRHPGECIRVCGGLGPQPPCETNEFCKFLPGICGDISTPGVCTDIPTACPEIYDPVCGCDGVTYDNECFSDMAEVSVDHRGECTPGPCAATRAFEPSITPASFCPDMAFTVRIVFVIPGGTSSIALEDEPPPGWGVSNISHNGFFDAANGKVKWGPFFTPFPPAVQYDVMPIGSASGIVACFDGMISIDGINEEICGQRCLGHNCPPHMAADIPQPPCTNCPVGDCTTCDDGCRNGRIRLCEVIGYACAWKTGCNDELAGVTRAAFIWRNGECYCWDGNQQNWFPSQCPPPASGLCADNTGGVLAAQAGSALTLNGLVVVDLLTSAKRHVKRQKSIQVTVRIEPPPGTSAAALELEIPSPWFASSISDAGEWDSARRKVKWGPFMGDSARSLTVVLEPLRSYLRGQGERGALLKEILGTVSFDGVNQPISISR